MPKARKKTATQARKLTSSQEDYLEAILLLVRRGQVARVRDIAKLLNVGMPSVTAALKILSKRELVNYDPYQVITLTDHGQEMAEGVNRRHDLLNKFFVEVLGLDEPTAEANACRMEHAVDSALVERLTKFVEFIHGCPRAGEDWVGEFAAYCAKGGPGDYDPCVARVRKSPQRKAT